MKLSRSMGYAIAALEYIYRQHPNSVAARQIAARYKIPLQYLQKVLQLLVRAGMLDAIRGPQGGFSLAQPAAKISLYDIFEAIEGGFAIEKANFPCKAARATISATIQTYSQAQARARKVFSGTTLVDLVSPAGAPKTVKKATRKTARKSAKKAVRKAPRKKS